eukprot:TRINITY_DN2308_c0_g1_i1.p1 TRINITY_DN2308_c0_g1~~TRINITY_DN2308_c0_g1_i1.p1  ORF type:complete len:525 (-),score=125.97 TRINITY_DN2308_c0_g1_i1:83-1630(-)
MKEKRLQQPFYFVFIIVIVSLVCLIQPSSQIDPFTCPECVQITIGHPEVISGPTGSDFDSPFLAIRLPNSLIHGYSANSASYLVSSGPNINSFLPTPLPINLHASSNPNHLDHCGAWLNAAFPDPKSPNLIRAWYHQEFKCNYSNNGFTNKSIAYAESHDQGKTFTKSSYYPNNAIILAPNSTSLHQTGEGDHTVTVVNDNYYYLYFMEWNGYNGGVTTGLARATVESGGVPGSWYKYYNGGFNEPGVKGRSSMIGGLKTGQSKVYFRKNFNDFIAVGIVNMAFSKEGIHWTQLNVPLMVVDDLSWNRNNKSFELIAYTALSGLYGNQDFGSPNPSTNSLTTFYIFYTWLPPHQTFASRYLVRRQISMQIHPNPISTPQVKLSLNCYYRLNTTHKNDKNGTVWCTTTQPLPEEEWKKRENIGYVLTEEYRKGGDTIRVYECENKVFGLRWMTRDEACLRNGEVRGEMVRTIGWVFGEERKGGKELWECWSEERGEYVAGNKECEGNGVLLGYVLE